MARSALSAPPTRKPGSTSNQFGNQLLIWTAKLRCRTVFSSMVSAKTEMTVSPLCGASRRPSRQEGQDAGSVRVRHFLRDEDACGRFLPEAVRRTTSGQCRRRCVVLRRGHASILHIPMAQIALLQMIEEATLMMMVMVMTTAALDDLIS